MNIATNERITILEVSVDGETFWTVSYGSTHLYNAHDPREAMRVANGISLALNAREKERANESLGLA